jgi:hypothetical protein
MTTAQIMDSVAERTPAINRDKFADLVRIHAISGDVISREDEMQILKDAITRFGMTLDDATGVLLSVAAENKIALVSNAEQQVELLMEQLVRRGKIGMKEFEDAVAIYKKLTNGGVPGPAIKKRVKQMCEGRGWKSRKSRWILGSRKWFKRI